LEKIIIVDDRVAEDPIQRQITKAVTPTGLTIDILKVNDAPKSINEAKDVGQVTMVLVKGPFALTALRGLGVYFKEVIIGGMQYRNGCKRITRTVSATVDEVKEFKRLVEEGVKLIVQQVPTDRRISLIPKINY